MSGEGPGVLSIFHPLIARWFATEVGEPTEVQEKAWAEIAGGSHVLVSAPTGTGKTLAAFLWGIDRLATGAWPAGKVRILYVSPLKALNNDIQKNLLSPLERLSRFFSEAGAAFPTLHVLTRSGDTPSSERRRMLTHPPEILITTPESLNLILSSPKGRLMLDGLATVILDEIHAVAATKRGTHLITAVERLVRLAGELQRVALSATVRPLSAVADFVGGYRVTGAGPDATFEKRRVKIVHCPMAKRYALAVEFPEVDRAASPFSITTAGSSGALPSQIPQPLWDALARECRRIIAASRSTLFFVNSRRHAEKLSRFINEGLPEPVAWSHHGSLSRELRLVVEQRLKKGELKAIVATSSLELGIDIGALDQVILIQSPFTVASAVQRLGRAGHAVGEESRGTIYALHGRDIVDAAVISRCVREQDIEEVSPVLCPLDVLAQVIVSMTAAETWNVEDLYARVRASHPFHTLPRQHFDLVMEMLAGRYADSRVRELSPMVSFDRISGEVTARESARIRLATSGGTIPDRGYFALRAADSKALLGELDEEFVWERALGDSFVLGTQGWRIQKIDHNSVEVVPVEARTAMSPFWKAEERNRNFHFSERIARALEEWNGRLADPGLPAELAASAGASPVAARAMVEFLVQQRRVTDRDLPHRHHLLVEHTRDPQGSGDLMRIVLHTLWGGRVNRPFSLALSAAWEEKHGYKPEMLQDDDTILLLLPEDADAAQLLSLVNEGNVERLLRARLEGSGFFGARFRESAGRSLLLPRASARGRTPLWLTRLRAKSLLSAVSRYDDFPLVIEAWRTCLQDEFDLASLHLLLGELAAGLIAVDETITTAPSPFCGSIAWKETNTFMYADDTPGRAGSGQGSTVRADLVRELALSADLRPRISVEVVRVFQDKLQRTAEGYAPRDALELLDWLKERLLVPLAEWEDLLAACERDGAGPAAELSAALQSRVTERRSGEEPAIAARELSPRLRAGLDDRDDEVLGELLAQWLAYYGPVEPSRVRRVFGLTAERLDAVIEDLAAEDRVVLDRLVAGSEGLLLCDRENLERLLRISRARARPSLAALPLERLPYFIAERQGLIRRGADIEAMKERWERLFGVGLPARLWEEDIFPARLEGYSSRWLDTLFAESGLLWFGCGRQRVSFCFAPDLELFLDKDGSGTGAAEASKIFPGPAGRYGFWDLADSSGLTSAELARRLWSLAWAGQVSTDSFQPVRRGMAAGFDAEEASSPGRTTSRRSFARWQATRPSSGFWYLLPREPGERDALDEEELARDRVRLLLERYGVVFRELLEPELPGLRWPRLFRTLRLMEFSGEVVCGRFFDGIPGLQFASPSTLESLAAAPDEDAVFWMNAADPASLCGAGLEGLRPVLPPRLPTTHLVFHGAKLVLVSRRTGRDLDFRVPPDAPRIPDYLGFVKTLTSRDQGPVPAVHVLTVNGEPVGTSPYRERLLACGFEDDYRRLTWRARG